MPSVSSPEPLLAALRRALEPRDDVRAVLLFGSQAQGTARKDSDIDVAVLLDQAPAQAERSAVLRGILEALGREVAADRVDLVLLHEASPKLAFHVVRTGLVAFERDPVDLHRFRVRTYSRHADYERVERFFREALKRRLLHQAEITRG